MKTLKIDFLIIVLMLFVALANFSCDKNDNKIENEIEDEIESDRPTEGEVSGDYYEEETSEVAILLTFENFKKMIKALKISDFTLMSITAGEDGSKEYKATYKNKDNKYFYIKIEEGNYHSPVEPIWGNSDNTYFIDDRKAEYFSEQTIHGLTIFLPQIEAYMMVYATTDLGKEKFESLAKESGFLKVNPETVNWPTEIPENQKLNGFLVSVEYGDYNDSDGFSKLLIATILLTDELEKSFYEKHKSFYEENSGYIAFPDGTYLELPDQNVENSLYNTYKKYERIEFNYYIP